MSTTNAPLTVEVVTVGDLEVGDLWRRQYGSGSFNEVLSVRRESRGRDYVVAVIEYGTKEGRGEIRSRLELPAERRPKGAPMNDKIEVTAATRVNMRRFAEAHPPKTINTPNGVVRIEGARCIAYSPTTGEEYSGDAGDYFTLGENEPLTDSEGDAMVLVTRRTNHYDALTGELI